MHLDIHQNAAQDLRDLQVVNPSAAAAVAVALEQIEADPKAIDKLTTFGNNIVGAARLNIKRWESVRGQGTCGALEYWIPLRQSTASFMGTTGKHDRFASWP